MDIVDQIPRALLIIGGIFVACFLGSLYFFNHESDYSQLLLKTHNYQSQIIELEANNERQKNMLASEEARKNQIVEVYKFVVQRNSLLSEIDILQKEQTDTLEVLYSSVLIVREAAAGLTIPELELKNNKKLYQAKVSKVDVTGIGFIHADGITRVPPDEMTDQMLARFRPDLDTVITKLRMSKLDEAQALDPSFEQPSTVMSTAPEVVSPSSPQVAQTNVSNEETMQIQQQISLIEIQISRLETEKQRYLDKANYYRSKTNSSTINSNPAVASAAERAAKALDSNLYSLQAAKAQLQIKLQSLSR